MSRELDRVISLIKFLKPCFIESRGSTPAYNHITALIADASLQAAVHYDRIVAPRIKSILERYPWCTQTQDLEMVLQTVSVEELLNWRGADKIQRFNGIFHLVRARGITDVQQLSLWVDSCDARTALLGVKGVGQKTFDYVRLLCGHAAFPIDRHILRFLRIAGIDAHRCGYERAQQLLTDSCKSLELEPSFVEKGLWNLMRSCA
jgi:hypothetical protein